MTDYRILPEPEDDEDDGPRATPADVRKAWSKYVDLDELRRLNQARKARTSQQDGVTERGDDA